jgi:sulfate adenylyltransferase
VREGAVQSTFVISVSFNLVFIMSDLSIVSEELPGIQPYGGKFAENLATGEALAQLKARAVFLPSLTLTLRQLCDIELLLNGGFSPINSFMNKATYDSVVESLRLPNGLLWPMPITLDVSQQKAESLLAGNESKEIALRDEEGSLLAVMRVDDAWQPDRSKEAKFVLGTTDPLHPGVGFLLQESGDTYLGGPLFGAQLPVHYDYQELRRTPRQTRAEFQKLGWKKIIAFQTRNPMHRAHRELTVRATQIQEEDGEPVHLFLHPVVGMTKPGDVDYHTRVKCYKSVLTTYPEGLAMLSLNPLAMRMGGPREVLWHAIIRRNFGCTHFIVGRDHAGPGDDASGKPFYAPYEAQELALQYEKELGVHIRPFQMMVYVESQDTYYPIDQVPVGEKTANISGTKLRELLRTGGNIPEWFTYPAVARILRLSYPPRVNQGFTVFFTGLSGAGKSTIANAFTISLLEEGSRQVSLLDGDIVRTHLSSELGFSKEHRDLNVKRIGYVASEITKARGAAVCAPIAPYEGSRRHVRRLIEQYGGFVEVYVSTSLEICEQRDKKGLYAKARSGQLKNFTGIDDPYEPPASAELVIDTASVPVRDAVQQILTYLRDQGFLSS